MSLQNESFIDAMGLDGWLKDDLVAPLTPLHKAPPSGKECFLGLPLFLPVEGEGTEAAAEVSGGPAFDAMVALPLSLGEALLRVFARPLVDLALAASPFNC